MLVAVKDLPGIVKVILWLGGVALIAWGTSYLLTTIF